ncbi:MAG: hypothetical protein K6E13_03120 [Lachnospiraceae bacterium]|nr:hypothetical protein [Lachnospiraceae bacterium]
MMIEKQKELFDEWKIDNPDIITYGIVNEDEYKKAPVRILYLLKEVNGGKAWDLCNYISNGGRQQTWDNKARWTRGILSINLEIPWIELESITNQQRIELLNKICVVNVKKTSGRHTSNYSELQSAARDTREQLIRQFQISNPQVIICCGTSSIYFEDIFEVAEPNWEMTSRGIYFVRENGRIVISYSHPEARVKDSLLYYGLIDAVKEIMW